MRPTSELRHGLKPSAGGKTLVIECPRDAGKIDRDVLLATFALAMTTTPLLYMLINRGISRPQLVVGRWVGLRWRFKLN